jgi:hypothetical protein
MHPVYFAYNFLCAIQPAIFLLMNHLGMHITTIDLDRKILLRGSNNSSNNNNITHNNNNSSEDHNNYNYNNNFVTLIPKVVNLDREMFICCVLAVAFSTTHICLCSLDDISPFLLRTSDDDITSGSLAENAIKYMEMIRVIFWLYTFFQYFIMFSVLNCFTTTEEKYLYTILKMIIVWVMCRTGKGRLEAKPLCIMLAAYMILQLFFEIKFNHRYDDANNSGKMVLVWMSETMLDAVLIFGHHWDFNAPTLTVVNCRLFYISLSCSLVQFLSFLSPPSQMMLARY